ncbi:hypothetical protein AGLY_007360, partial [Aphis glycines]
YNWKTELKKIPGLVNTLSSENGNDDDDESSSSSESIESVYCSSRELFECELAYNKYRSILPRPVDYKNKVAQMLSEKQDTMTICNCLSNWKKNAIHAIHGPNEKVCDYSKELIGALTRSFCDGMSLKTLMMCETDRWVTEHNQVEKSPSEKCREFILSLIQSNGHDNSYDNENDHTEPTETGMLPDLYLCDQEESEKESNVDISKIEKFLNNIKEKSYQNSKIKGFDRRE